jgi:hypothetical protein
MIVIRWVVCVIFAWAGTVALAAPVVFQQAGTSGGAIQPVVDAFRTALGSLNTNVAGSFGSGRREINWDGVPNTFSAPNNLPGSFFNSISPRGVELSTPGTGFQVSANAGFAPVEFGNIDASYPTLFSPFSAQRLFTALGSTITDVRFFVPGSGITALSNAFGVVFSDVDLANTTSLQFFDAADNSLGNFFAPSATGNETFSFLGVQFTEGNVVSRVRITSGNQVLAAGNTVNDLVVMDDFIYGEPVHRVPEPATLWLLFAGALASRGARPRRASA